MSNKQPSFSKRSSYWMRGGGPSSDVIVSSRLRLARNLSDVPFPPEMSREHAQKVLEQAEQVIDSLKSRQDSGYRFVRMDSLPEIEQWVLVEKHLISPQLVQTAALSGVILSDDEAVSIMVNEEDHFRIQCLFPGLNLDEGKGLVLRVDQRLCSVIEPAFDEQLGYLTTCPTNLGTGMRASVMAHLPGLVMLDRLDKVISGLSEIGATIRGLYGEGTDSQGDLFQISNRVTLGQDETEICNNLHAVVSEVVDKERSARETVYGCRKEELEDRVYRAYGLLTNARMMPTKEAMRLLSALKLGLDLNIIPHVSGETFSELMINMRPALIQSRADSELDSRKRDVRRATLIRNTLLNT